jgi:uncharacterized protein
MKRLLLVCVFVVSLFAVSALARPGQTTPQPARPTFLVVYRPGPAFLAGKPLAQQPLQEHGRYILSLYVKGALKHAGPFGDDTGGAAVFEATDETEAKAIVAADPAVVSGVFLADLHPWTLVDWQKYVRK